MAAQYKMQFISLKGIEYEVQIYDESFDSTSAISLTAGSNPFTTDEDDDDSPACWIRECTGYVRFIDEDNDTALALCTAEPYSMHVNLYDQTHGKYVFRGFLKPEQYNQKAFGLNEEVEIPIVSHLTRMCAKFMSNSIEGIKSVGEILSAVMDGGYDYALIPNNVLMQNRHIEVSETAARNTIIGEDCLYYLPSYNTPKATQVGFWVDNFKNIIKRVAPTEHSMWGTGPYEPCTYGDILKGICALFGWNICEDDGMLVCRDINQQSCVTYQKISRSQLTGDSNYSELVNDSTASTSTLHYCSDDHKYETIAPYSIVSVKSEARVQSKSYIDISDVDNVALNGVHSDSNSDVTFEVPLNSDALTQYHHGGTAYGLLKNPSIYGGELVGWLKDNSAHHSVLLQDNGSTRDGLVIYANEPTLLLPRMSTADYNLGNRLKVEGTMRCNDDDGVISNGDYFTGWLTINVNAGGCGMIGNKNYTSSKLSELCHFNINYDACSKLSSYTEVLDRNTPLYSMEVVRSSVTLFTCASRKHVIIDDLKLHHTVKTDQTLYTSQNSYGDVGYTKVVIPQSDDNKLEISTKLGIPYTDGALTMHYRLPIAVTNSSKSTFRYARFLDFPTKQIGTIGTVENCLRRVFENVVTNKVRHKLTIRINDQVNYTTRVAHNGKTYLPIARKWNWRDDECELSILSVPELMNV